MAGFAVQARGHTAHHRRCGYGTPSGYRTPSFPNLKKRNHPELSALLPNLYSFEKQQEEIGQYSALGTEAFL